MSTLRKANELSRTALDSELISAAAAGVHTGEAGEAFIFDTNAIHKAGGVGLAAQGVRDVMFFEFNAHGRSSEMCAVDRTLPCGCSRLGRARSPERPTSTAYGAQAVHATWLASGQVGHCGRLVTRTGDDCQVDDHGLWTLASAAWENWTSAAAACLAQCDGCERCAFVTLSLRFKHCSWYRTCQLTPAPGFRSGIAPKSHAPTSIQRDPPAIAHNLRPGLGEYEHVPKACQSFERWRGAIEAHLEAADYQRFARATGSSMADVLSDPVWQRPEGTALLSRVMSNDKFVPHPLNAKGLHVLRALLAERMTHRRRTRLGLTAHPLFKRMMRDGIVVLPSVQNLSELTTSVMALVDPAKLQVSGHSYLAKLLQAFSGYKYLDLEGFDDWSHLVHHSADAQRWMHVDTFMPTWKAWIFKETPLHAGPFTYVYGSHRNTEHKLRWLFNRTRRYVSQQAVDALHNPGVNAKRLPMVRPWSDESFGFDPAIRYEGFEPGGRSHLTTALLGHFGFDPPSPVVTGSGWTLVVADTSGLHCRGWARTGAVRISSVLRSSLVGEDFLPRKNVFFCDQEPDEC